MDRNGKDKSGKRPFVGIYFKCCNLYGRIYKNKAGTAYEGACPGCGGKVYVPIGEKGTSLRFFTAE